MATGEGLTLSTLLSMACGQSCSSPHTALQGGWQHSMWTVCHTARQEVRRALWA